MTAQIGLFEGYGGLTLGVQAVIPDADLVAYAEIEPAMIRLLDARHPDVPNLGDVTEIDWAAFIVEHPEIGELTGTYRAGLIITGGFPCQDVSLAGLRAGLVTGSRSGLWSEYARAIATLRPGLVIIENVRGLLSARAGDPEEVGDDEEDSDLELGAWSLGTPARGGGPVLRAIGAVLGDLADLGYDARWVGVRASDAGAPHGRLRIFIVARPADAPSLARSLGYGDDVRPRRGADRREPTAGRSAADPDTAGRRRDRRPAQPTRALPESPRVREDEPAPDAPRVAVGASTGERDRPRPTSRARAQRVPGGRAPVPADAGRRRRGADERDVLAGEPDAGGRAPADADRRSRGRRTDIPVGGSEGRATPLRDRGGHDRGEAAPDAVRGERQRRRGPGDVAGETRLPREPDGHPTDEIGDAPRDRGPAAPDRWGPYGPAVRRWESVLGRVAPAPTAPGSRGGERLSAAFVEWMMGVPAGHVTGPELGLTRAEQLKALGNGVVPQQAALAIASILAEWS